MTVGGCLTFPVSCDSKFSFHAEPRQTLASWHMEYIWITGKRYLLINILRLIQKLWGSRWRRRRRGFPWRSGAGYFPRSPGCRRSVWGASGKRSGRRQAKDRSKVEKGGRWRSRRTTHVQHGVQMTDTWTTWANVVWHIISETWNTTNGALLCSLVQIVRSCDCSCHCWWCTWCHCCPHWSWWSSCTLRSHFCSDFL